MTRSKTFSLCFALAAGLFLLTGPETAEARAQYNKAFKGMYESNFQGQDVKLKCNVCHGNGGKNKKVNSEYALQIKEALGAKNVRDAEKIDAALKTAAEKPSEVEGKTYGELLAEGILPKPAE